MHIYIHTLTLTFFPNTQYPQIINIHRQLLRNQMLAFQIEPTIAKLPFSHAKSLSRTLTTTEISLSSTWDQWKAIKPGLLGGTKPKPDAPITTPLVSPLSGGACGNRTGPRSCLESLCRCRGTSKPPLKAYGEPKPPNWAFTIANKLMNRTTMAWNRLKDNWVLLRFVVSSTKFG